MAGIQKDGTFKKEYNKIKRIIKSAEHVDKKHLEILEGLITTAAYNYSEMEELMVKMKQEGTVVRFKNGKQDFIVKHPGFEMYTKLQSQYLQIMKELLKILESPDGEKIDPAKEALDKLMNLRKDKINNDKIQRIK